jgi:diaminopimelate decarboxylase
MGFAVAMPAVHLLLGLSLDRLGGNPLESGPAWLSLAGGLIAGAGLLLIVTSAATLHRAGRGLPLSSSPPVLLVEIGPYRRLRHPIYTGAVMLFVGSAIVLGSFWSAAVTGPLLGFFYFAYAAGKEEPVLRKRYGQRYAAYSGRAAFFLPLPLRGRLIRAVAGLLRRISRAVNRPAILRRGEHILFWGYGIWVGVGIGLGLAAMEFVLIAAGMEPGQAMWGVAVATLAGLTGSRLGWRVLTSVGERTHYRHTSSRVGFVSWGALVALLVLLSALSLVSGESLLRYLDAAFPALMIAQMLARIGCTFYGCCSGLETESILHIHYVHPALKAVRQGQVNGGRLIPAQLLSAVNGGLIALVVFGLWLARPLPLGVPGVTRAGCRPAAGAGRIGIPPVGPGRQRVVLLLARKIPGQRPGVAAAASGPVGSGRAADRGTVQLSLPGGGEVALSALDPPMSGTDAVAGRVQSPQYENSTLCWYGCDLQAIAERHGTPTHVGCAEAVGDAVASFRSPFRESGLDIGLRYSVKTNPVPAYLNALADLDVGFEVCSAAELEIVRRLGAEPGRVVATGLRGGPHFAIRSSAPGVQMHTLATPGQVEQVLDQSADLPAPLNVGLSICPELPGARWDLTLNTGGRSSAIGFRPGSADLEDAAAAIAASNRMNLVGLHMHIGSGIRSASPYRRAFRTMEKVIRALAVHGHQIAVLDIGGGFGLSSAPVMGAWKIASNLFRPGLPGRAGSDQDAILSRVAAALAEMLERLERSGLRPPTLLAEPGRILSGPCQLLLLSVAEVVDRGPKARYLLCDGGSMAISPMLLTQAHRVLAVRDRGGERSRYQVLGTLPTSLDRVSSGAMLPPMQAGDCLAVLDTGAYFVSMNNTFGGPRLPIVWIERAEAGLARRRESEAELLARDHLPADQLLADKLSADQPPAAGEPLEGASL